MDFNKKLRELRLARNLTQENVAQYLKVSSQTVSKWERGLLSPDITLLPKIALLYHCSMDTLFDMDTVWGETHRKEFEERIHLLSEQRDWEGIYNAWIHEIEMHPDRFFDYTKVMEHVLRKQLLDKNHINSMLSLADYAERYCTDDEIRNEIFRIMLQICAKSSSHKIQEKTQYYYKKLPLFRHSREVYCRYALQDDQYYAQVKKNIFYSIDICECAVRQLVSEKMPMEEQLYYYQKAASLYEIVLDDKYGGLFDIPLIQNYCKIADLLISTGQKERAETVIDRIISVLKRHLSDEERKNTSVFLSEDAFEQNFRVEKNCKYLLHAMLQNMNFAEFHTKLSQFLQEYCKHME